MDITKFKSVALKKELYEKIRKEAHDNDRSVSHQLAHIVKQYFLQREAA